MPEDLFRKSSLEGLQSPEQLDQLLVVVKPKGWIAAITLFLLLTAGVIWSFVARIPVQVETKGIINTPEQFFTVKSLVEGSVEEIKVKKGDFIEIGQPLLVLSESDGGSKTIDSPVRGILFRLDVALQDFVNKGNSLLCISQALKEGEHLQAFGYLPVHYQRKVIEGMEAEAQVEDFTLKGKVVSISPHSLSSSEILKGLPVMQWLEFLNPTQEPVLEVAIAFDFSSPHTIEKYPLLAPGELCLILITLSDQRPIKFVIP